MGARRIVSAGAGAALAAGALVAVAAGPAQAADPCTFRYVSSTSAGSTCPTLSQYTGILCRTSGSGKNAQTWVYGRVAGPGAWSAAACPSGYTIVTGGIFWPKSAR